jgi:hypothetical protein
VFIVAIKKKRTGDNTDVADQKSIRDIRVIRGLVEPIQQAGLAKCIPAFHPMMMNYVVLQLAAMLSIYQTFHHGLSVSGLSASVSRSAG